MPTPIIDRSKTALDFGGHPQKQNYMGRGAVNPKTDITAQNVNNIAELCAVRNRMQPLARVLCDASGNVLAALTAWGNYSAYAVGATPTDGIVTAKTGTGTYTLTFPNTVTGWDGASRTVTPGTAVPVASVASTSATTVTGQVVSVTTGSPAADAGFMVTVW